MPEISRFFGIVIRMFAEPTTPHHRPHFHAFYQDRGASSAHAPSGPVRVRLLSIQAFGQRHECSAARAALPSVCSRA
ncbi:MAG: DUF4160 domain-containing protein [Acidobacteria bacterium]|nr:DUF4160 domain-containing protein [Acidobacteriota bacterium]